MTGVRSAAELARDCAAGTVPARATVTKAFERAEEVKADARGLNAILSLDRDGALGAADGIARLHGEGATPTPLAGVPVVLKDNIATATMPTSGGSRSRGG